MPRNRIAALQLRGSTSPLPVRVYWPSQEASQPGPLLVFCMAGAGARAWPEGFEGPGAEASCRGLSENPGLTVLSVGCGPADSGPGGLVLEWAAEHAAELGADPGRLLVGGQGAGGTAAAALALDARTRGWPPVTRQVLISASPVAPRAVAGAAPATVVTLRHHTGGDEGRYAAWLRRAGVEVDELVYPEPLLATGRVLADLGEALRRSLATPAMNIRGPHRPSQ
jgi:hypothetical protein